MAAVEVGISATEIKEFARKLRAYDDAKFRRVAMKQLKGVAAEAVVAAKAAAGAIPSKGGTPYKEPALRPLLQNAVIPAFRSGGKSVGVSVRVARTRLPENRRGAEKVLEYGGRHPLFERSASGPRNKKGKRGSGVVHGTGVRWIPQEAHPWFHTTMLPFREKVVAEFTKVMKQIGRDIGFK